MSTLISYQRKHPRATELLLQRGGIHCALLVSVLGNVTVRCRRTTGLKLIQLGLEQGLQTSAVFALVGTKLGDTVFQRGLLGLDRGHNFVVLLVSFCLKCSSLILSLTDLRLSTGVSLRLGLLSLSFSIRNHLLGAGIRLRQLSGRTGLGVSQLLLRSLTCLRQHGVRLRACLIGQAVCHILGKAQDASSLHVGFWSCCAGGAGSSTCGSAGGGSGSWSSRGGSLAGPGAAAVFEVLALLPSALALRASAFALWTSDLASAYFLSSPARSSDSPALPTEASCTAGAAAAPVVDPEPS